jgi:ABC-type dipeptide/oligopeptide/nickel transport system permease subunit
MLCFPVLLFAVGLGAACSATEAGCAGGLIKPGALLVMVIIGISTWPLFTRLVRGQVLSLRHRLYVDAARALGLGELRILASEVLPGLMTPVAVAAVFTVPTNMVFEAGLAFLGLGVPEPSPTWGTMLADSATTFDSAWWYVAAPAAAIALTAILLNVVAEAAGANRTRRVGR